MAEMDKEFFVIQMARLSLIFRGSFEGAEGQARLAEYFSALGYCQENDLQEAVSNMIREYDKDWFPIPADIRVFIQQAASRRHDTETAVKYGLALPAGEQPPVRQIGASGLKKP